ncbi:uncharacterized protein LOC132720171 [Ruditapes philippinarum]|uniref:uncharacterized protein LOC132720171 n=1 Tax=Ruditapes philippinarum TaxID=129788 RepID=UPI00295B9445|nr:uncharacterized protein LOC132720171 [Ruditapes philippinarum]
MASSGGEEIPLQRVWSRVHIDVRHLDQKIETIVISQSDLVYKLQFALLGENMKNSLLLRLKTKGISMKVQENRESVLVELQKQLPRNEVINAVENALAGLMIKKYIFANEQEFSQFLDTLKEICREFLLNGTVVLLFDSSEDSSILNVVGLEGDVVALEDIYGAEVEKEN